MRLALPDLVSSSYFPALAATTLPDTDGKPSTLELVHLFPARVAMQALSDGEVDAVAAAAHEPLAVFPQWRGATLLMALAQRTYWLLVVRADAAIGRNEPNDLHDLTIAAAPGPDLALRRLLHDWNIDDADRRITIRPLANPQHSTESFGIRAAQALRAQTIDAFWANGMAAQIAVDTGAGKIVLDPRRGDGPRQAAGYTFPALITSRRVLASRPELVHEAFRAVLGAQAGLRRDPSLARRAVAGVFPEREADVIEGLVRRDAPFYDPAITAETVRDLNSFAITSGLLDDQVAYDEVVDPTVRDWWSES
jgi:ABC-type nitrate/sulfonate/bicarbonate transport system substrate-binding protein